MSDPKSTTALIEGNWRVEVEAEPECDDEAEVYVCHEGTVCTATAVCTIGWTAKNTLDQKVEIAQFIASAPDLARDNIAMRGALSRAALDLHEAAGRFSCIDKLDPKGVSELTREAARRADAALKLSNTDEVGK